MPRAPESVSNSGTASPSRWLRDSLRSESVRPDSKDCIPPRAACSKGPARLPFTCSIVAPGFSLPAIEAMCTGTPLVATDGGALPEVTGTDGDTVFQCKAGDAEGLAARIRDAVDDPEARARIGAAGRQRVVERWSWSHCAKLTVDQYREVLAMPQNVAKLRKNGRI